MRKRLVGGLVLGLMLLMPAAARAQFEMIQPTTFTGPFSHPGFEQGGWFVGADFLFLTKVFGNYNGTAPDSILSVGYRAEDGNVYQFSWMDQWFSENPNPTDKLQIIDFTARIKTYDNGCYRQWATFGPRAILTSVDFSFPGGLSYSVDNTMLGLFVGAMNEWYLGTNPLGAFSFTLDGDIGAYANFIRQAAGSAGGSNTLTPFTLSGSMIGKAGFIWYVWEGITIHAGLDVMTIINLQQPATTPAPAGGAINAALIPTMPVWFGMYLGFGFVF